MKKDLKISTLSIVCVLCTAAIPSAYGAASVRSLGGTGTYSSASSAAKASAGTSSGSAAINAARAGSVRVTSAASKTGSAAASTTATVSGRAATSPRLSIGKYLGGGTSVSGGSSVKPQTPSSSTGSSSGGSSMDPGLASDLRAQINQLDAKVQDLDSDIGNLLEVNDAINDALDEKQNVLTASDGYIGIENDEIFLDVDAVKTAIGSASGSDAREIELRKTATAIEWRYSGGNWAELVLLTDITGPQGEQGLQGEQGAAANMDEYSTTAQMNAVIEEKIAAAAGNYASAADMVALQETVTSVGNSANAAVTAANKAATDIAALDMVVAGKADKSYVDEELAKKANKSDLANLATKEDVEKVVGGDLSGVYATVDSVESLAQTHSADVQKLTDEKADKTALKTVEDGLAAVKADVEANSGAIADLGTDILALQTEVAANKTALSGVDEKIAGFATSDELKESLEGLATKEDLSEYAKSDEIPSVEGLVTQEDLENYATTEQVENYATQVENYATTVTEIQQDLSENYVVKNELNTEITTVLADNTQVTNIIGDVVTEKLTDITINNTQIEGGAENKAQMLGSVNGEVVWLDIVQ